MSTGIACVHTCVCVCECVSLCVCVCVAGMSMWCLCWMLSYTPSPTGPSQPQFKPTNHIPPNPPRHHHHLVCTHHRPRQSHSKWSTPRCHQRQQQQQQQQRAPTTGFSSAASLSWPIAAHRRAKETTKRRNLTRNFSAPGGRLSSPRILWGTASSGGTPRSRFRSR